MLLARRSPCRNRPFCTISPVSPVLLEPVPNVSIPSVCTRVAHHWRLVLSGGCRLSTLIVPLPSGISGHQYPEHWRRNIMWFTWLTIVSQGSSLLRLRRILKTSWVSIVLLQLHCKADLALMIAISLE